MILRGGSEAFNSNLALVSCLQSALRSIGLPAEVVSFVESTDRAQVLEMMRLNGIIDCLIPRGGASLIKTIVENSSIPVIETGTGKCHVYVDKAAVLAMATEIIINAKTQRTSVCNSAESLLIHREIAQQFLPIICSELQRAEVEIFGDDLTVQLAPFAKQATEEDWYEEYLDLKISSKVVDSLQDAVSHINKYSSHHSDAIITAEYDTAEYFTGAVDSAAVYVNASTRFTDGYEFGFGAEKLGFPTKSCMHAGRWGCQNLRPINISFEAMAKFENNHTADKISSRCSVFRLLLFWSSADLFCRHASVDTVRLG